MKWKRMAHLEQKKMPLNDARKAIETLLHQTRGEREESAGEEK